MVYSYVHNDHFWNYGSINGGTQKDPNKAFIVNEGFCYYAYAGYKERPYSFSDIKHDPANWIILDQEDGGFVTDGITSNLLSYFKINEDDVFVGESLISYSKADENNFLTMNFDKDSSIWDVFIDDNLVYSLKNNSDIFYENNIQSIVDTYNYEILNVNLSLIADRHYDYEGNADDEVGVYEVIFTYNLSNNGNPFLEENYVKIGVNPVTGDITSIKTKIMPIGESNEIIDYKLIDNDFNDLVSQNGEIYYKAYYKTNNQYRPAIYKIDTSDIEVVKVY
jgi:hypothetical protein